MQSWDILYPYSNTIRDTNQEVYLIKNDLHLQFFIYRSNATNKSIYYFTVNLNIWNHLDNFNEYILQVSRLILMETINENDYKKKEYI